MGLWTASTPSLSHFLLIKDQIISGALLMSYVSIVQHPSGGQRVSGRQAGLGSYLAEAKEAAISSLTVLKILIVWGLEILRILLKMI